MPRPRRKAHDRERGNVRVCVRGVNVIFILGGMHNRAAMPFVIRVTVTAYRRIGALARGVRRGLDDTTDAENLYTVGVNNEKLHSGLCEK